MSLPFETKLRQPLNPRPQDTDDRPYYALIVLIPICFGVLLRSCGQQ